MTIAERRMDRMVGSVAHVFEWYIGGDWEQHHLDPGIADFAFGNPQEMPLPGLVDALQRNADAQGQGLVRLQVQRGRTAARSWPTRLQQRTGIDFRPEDIALTAGAFGALGVTIRALCDEDDEVIFLSPPWFFYELMIASSGATAVRVRLQAPDLRPRSRRHRGGDHAAHPGDHRQQPEQPDGPDLSRSPSWPRSATSSTDASERHGRPIVLLSDESYNRIVFDGIDFRSPALDYAATMTIYTYGKTLLAPGQRIGYAAMTPDVPRPRGDRPTGSSSSSWPPAGASRTRCCSTRSATSRRCRSTSARSRPGATGWSRRCARWATRSPSPEGTFYLMVRSPDPDDLAFTDPPGRARRARPAGHDRRVARAGSASR